MKKNRFSILFHNYYGQHEYWLDYFFKTIPGPFFLFYNLVADSVHNFDHNIYSLFKEYQVKNNRNDVTIVVCLSPDQGKDIGGKFVLLDSFLRIDVVSDYFIFLHDKKSPQTITGHAWYEGLISVFRGSNIEKVIQLFDKEKKTGIIASQNFIVDEVDHKTGLFRSKNAPILKELCTQYNIVVKQYLFVAGTIFAARSEPLIEFFKEFKPLDIRRTLEIGNVVDDFEGTQTHSWERMLSWIIQAKGYNLKGI